MGVDEVSTVRRVVDVVGRAYSGRDRDRLFFAAGNGDGGSNSNHGKAAHASYRRHAARRPCEPLPRRTGKNRPDAVGDERYAREYRPEEEELCGEMTSCAVNKLRQNGHEKHDGLR